MWKSIASNALTLFIILLVALAGLIAWGRHEFVSPGPLHEAVCVEVGRGANLSMVSRQLEDRGVVSDARIFRIGAQYSGKAGDLKHGAYLVKEAASMQEVLDTLTAGGQSTCGEEISLRIGVSKVNLALRRLDVETGHFIDVVQFAPDEDRPAEFVEAEKRPDMRFRVTLVEGATVWQVVHALESVDFLGGKVEDEPPEGSLAPGTYDVERDSDRDDLLTRMEDAQSAVMDRLWPERSDDLPYDTPEEAMVMASIIEKETAVPEERKLVASVLVNRLRQGMPLQMDPTVIYGITKGKTVLDRGLTKGELGRDTPYNTYIHRGLPPGPIANPGPAAIEAALHPADTDYLYFVADGTGGHAFAATLTEHNRNVGRWREIEAQRAAGKEVEEGAD